MLRKIFALSLGLALAVTASPAPAANITLSVQQAAGADWNTPGQWSDGNPAMPGNTYQVLTNALLRSPNNATNATFPGDRLTLDNGGELRCKSSPLGTLIINDFHLNGGKLNQGNGGTTTTIEGNLTVDTDSFIDLSSEDGRSFLISAMLHGSGNLILTNAGAATPMQVTGSSNTYSGNWKVESGYLKGSGTGSLGSGNITIASGAVLETTYDIVSPGTLTLNGFMLLHQNDKFGAVTINGTPLSPGTHSFTELINDFPDNFDASDSASGSIGVPGTNITLSVVETLGEDWSTPLRWSDGKPAIPGNTYEVLAGALLRSPDRAASATFPGERLTLDSGGELRSKSDSVGTLIVNDFHLNGGRLNQGNTSTTTTIAGTLSVDADSIIDLSSDFSRSFTITAVLKGSGGLTLASAETTNLPVEVTGSSNTYSGHWKINTGYLKGSGVGSLGSGNITIANGAKLETTYDIVSAATLTLNGLMILHQNDTFGAATINGTPLAPGTHSVSELAAAFPGNFAPGGSGSITIVVPVLRLTIPAKSGQDMQFGFMSDAGKTYRVDFNSDLSGNNWTVLTSNLAGTGGFVTVTDTNAASLSQRFYRASY